MLCLCFDLISWFGFLVVGWFAGLCLVCLCYFACCFGWVLVIACSWLFIRLAGCLPICVVLWICYFARGCGFDCWFGWCICLC